MSDTSLIHDPSRNLPDYAAEETARLAREFAEIERAATDILAEAKELPPTVEDIDTANLYTKTIGRIADLDDRVEALRVSEGLPYMRRKDAVDSFFFRIRERLRRRKKTDKAGGADVLQNRLHDYNERRRLEEQRRRDEEARIAREEEERLRRERQEQERIQREAQEKADRARKEQNKEAAAAAAREAEAAAEKLRVAEDQAREKRQDTQAAAQAKPGDMVRERHDEAMNTMRQVWHVEVTDAMKLDAVTLWPFVKDAEKEAALKAWAKTTGHRKQMPGAVIEQRAETVVRR